MLRACLVLKEIDHAGREVGGEYARATTRGGEREVSSPGSDVQHTRPLTDAHKAGGVFSERQGHLLREAIVRFGNGTPCVRALVGCKCR